MLRRIGSFFPGYLFALGANLAALGLTLALEPVLVPSPFPIFVLAVAVSAWFYGVGAGLFSTLIATAATNYFFIPPLFLLTLGKEDVSRFVAFLVVTVIAISLMRAQKLAAEARAQLGAIVASSDDAIIGVSLNGAVTTWNTGAERSYGYTAREAAGRSILFLSPPECTPEMTAVLERVRRGEAVQQHETVLIPRSGARIDASITISPIRAAGGGITGAALIARDITARRRAEKALQETTVQLHQLSRRLVEVQENERAFIARELHDEVGQVLTGLKLSLELLPHLPPEQAGPKTAQARELVAELLERVSRLTIDLRPPMLDDLGLLPTLLWHFQRYTSLTGIPVSFAHAGLERQRFAPEVETGAYRIIQEALTNIARHAGARRVEARVDAGGGGIKIQVTDDGQGFDARQALLGGKAAGLVGMRERAELLGGSLAIRSAPGQGARLEVELPIAAADLAPAGEAA